MYDGAKLQQQYTKLAPQKKASGGGGKSKAPTVEIPVKKFGNALGYIDLSSALASVNNAYQTAILVVRGSDIAKMIDNPDIYHSNIRGYLGHGGRINKGMKKTLELTPEMFYLRNNGISALCSSFKFSATRNVLTCQDFQIINGAQTSSTLGKFENLKELEKVNVLLRVTGTGMGGEDSQVAELRHDIIESNNSQNPVRVSDFHSNDKIQEFLQKEFAKLHYAGGTKPGGIFYMMKRGDPMPNFVPRPPQPKTLKMEVLAKSLFAYNSDHPPSCIRNPLSCLERMRMVSTGICSGTRRATQCRNCRPTAC